ncbi:MAG: glutathione S-transferase family protein [Alphaproteobacteria bacterium]
MSDQPLRIVGAHGSPYSRKLRAVLRYRRIPHAWINQGWPETSALPQPRVVLLPQLVEPGPDGELVARTDSSPLLRELERRHPGRSVIPPDPVVAFLDLLLEDFADEWLTKAMFHYRWAFEADADHAASILPRWFKIDQPEESAVAGGRAFAKRQIGRLGVVGSNPTTAPVIEESYRRFLHLLDAHLVTRPFLFGHRPASADFGVFGQLTQLVAFDPTPMAIAVRETPRVAAWVDVVEDLSGLETDGRPWTPREELPSTLRAILGEVGRVYAPFLLANAAALEAGADTVECTIDGRPWTQKPFPYQGKCLFWLREAREALAVEDRHAVDGILAGTGCEALFKRS